MTISATLTTSDSVLWNGPTCQTCGTRYLGQHTCSNQDILRRVGELLRMLDQPQPARRCTSHSFDRMAHCPCRPENGGSGVCGCIMGGPQVIC